MNAEDGPLQLHQIGVTVDTDNSTVNVLAGLQNGGVQLHGTIPDTMRPITKTRIEKRSRPKRIGDRHVVGKAPIDWRWFPSKWLRLEIHWLLNFRLWETVAATPCESTTTTPPGPAYPLNWAWRCLYGIC